MLHKVKTIFFNLKTLTVTLWFCGICSTAFSDEKSPTFFLNVGSGFSSHKSKAIESNDTSFFSFYSFGVNAGQKKNLALFVSNRSIKTAFELNESSVETNYQDIIFRYYWGPVYIGPILSQTEMILTRDTGTAINLDAFGTGFGVNLGLEVFVGKRSKLFLDIASTSISAIKEVAKSEFAVGANTDISFGGIIPITRSLLNSQVGVTQKSYSLTLDGQTFAEVVTMTWFGFGLNFFF